MVMLQAGNTEKDITPVAIKRWGHLISVWFSGIKTPSLYSLFVLILILIGTILRLYHIENLHTVEPDERLWIDAGVSLIKDKVPTSWTIRWPYHNWAAYDSVDGSTVTPWLDHPPLFALMSGGWTILAGQDNVVNLKWGLQRLPMAVISVLTVWLTYLFVKRAYNRGLAFFVLMALVFFPSHVIASRFALAENAIPLFLMAGAYALAVCLSTPTTNTRRISSVMAFTLAFLAPLLKLSGIVVPMTLALFLFMIKRYKLGWAMIGVGACSVGTFMIYAWFYGWEVFIGAQKAHVLREQSFENFWTLFTRMDIGNYTLSDPSLIVGFIGLIALMVLENKLEFKTYIFSAVFSLSFLLLYISPVESYVWYKYPLYPWLAIGLGYVFWSLYHERFAYLVIFLPMVGMMLQHSLLVDSQHLRKVAIIIFYAISTVPLLTGSRIIRLRRVFVVLLVGMFFFQVVWIEWASRCITPCH
jgi:hypothetical protein